MILQDLVFQGVYGCHQPARVSFSSEQITRERLPAGVTVSAIHTLLTALLYPSWLTEQERREVEVDGIKLALTFEFKDRRYRLLRREDSASLRLQVRDADAYKELSEGPIIEDLLQEKLQLQDRQVFWMLNAWRLNKPLPAQATGLSSAKLDARAKEIVRSYRIAHAHEKLEDRLKSLEGQVEQARRTLGDGAKLEDKLNQAKQRLKELAVKTLSEDDLHLLHTREARVQDLSLQLMRLTQEDEQARAQLDAVLPEKPWRQPVFWGGLGIFIVALGASIALRDSARQIAVADIIGLSMCAWVALRYFNDLEKASVHIVRLDSIKRRLNQVRDEQIAFQERLKHLLIHAGVEREDELVERVEKSQKLSEMIAKMEEQLGRISAKPEYREASKQLRQLEAELDQARARLESSPKAVLSAFQLENDLQQLGIDPVAALEEQDEADGEPRQDPAPYNATAMTRGLEAARRVGALSSGELEPKVVRMWSKIAGHLLGPKFQEVSLDRQGQLLVKSLTPEQTSMWLKTRHSEVELLAHALCLALLVNAPATRCAVRALLIEAPTQTHGGELAGKLDEVLGSAAQKIQIVLLS